MIHTNIRAQFKGERIDRFYPREATRSLWAVEDKKGTDEGSFVTITQTSQNQINQSMEFQFCDRHIFK